MAGLVAIAAFPLIAAGCGDSAPDSDAKGFSVYVTPPFCAGARSAMPPHGPRSGDQPVVIVCLDRVVSGHTLASIGAGARRAGEDSTTIAYVGEPDRKSVRFSRPILEAAGIADVTGENGAAAMATFLRALRRSAGADDLRGAVLDEVEAAR